MDNLLDINSSLFLNDFPVYITNLLLSIFGQLVVKFFPKCKDIYHVLDLSEEKTTQYNILFELRYSLH